MSGGGTMEPIPGVPGGQDPSGAYKPYVRTILPLAKYAELIGINPIQFMSGSDQGILFPTTGCSDRWWHYSWQDPNKVSRTDIALEIKHAEQDITSQLKYFPGPAWVEEEELTYPRYHRRELTGLRGYTPNGQYKSVNLRYGSHISYGKRAISLIASEAAVVYSDEDSDGFNETATITAATTLTNACEIKLFFTGYDGDTRYEIRPLRTVSFSSGNVIITLDSWLLFKLSLQSAWPGGDANTGPTAIDATDTDSYVASVDIYREYADPEEQCTLYWEGAPGTLCDCNGSGCPSCDPITQVACLQPRSEFRNSVSVIPATYNGSFTPSTFCTGYEPSRVKVSYRSGEYEMLNGCMEVPDDLALAITYIATARLSRPLCTDCENVSAREDYLSEDLIYLTDGESNATKFVTRDVTTNPFGTKRGEVEAWRIVQRRKRQGLVRRSMTVV